MKHSRKISFFIILAAYLFAATAGIYLWFKFGTFQFWQRVFIADIAATAVIFLISVIFDNASVYDPYWSIQPMVITPLLAAAKGNFGISSILLIILIELWGARLTLNWARNFKDLSVQDWRYENIRKKTGKAYYLIVFLGIQLMPTLIVFACQMPIIEFFKSEPRFSFWCVIGILISLYGIILEVVADHAKRNFRSKGNTGVVNIGIWKRHRHPNYLGEIMFWWGIWAVVFSFSPELWWTFFGSAINTFLFLFISIPLAEKQSEKRHSEEWGKYRDSTSIF